MIAGQDGKGPMASLNVTPLIDVLLVLIITFMVISPLTPHGLDAQVTRPGPSVGDAAVVITMDAAGNIRINQNPVERMDLGRRLEDIFKTRNERSIFLKCDASLAFSKVASVIDLARGAGIVQVGLITDKIAEAH